jgi:hypothetical protein
MLVQACMLTLSAVNGPARANANYGPPRDSAPGFTRPTAPLVRPDSNNSVTSTYYLLELPEWLKALNGEHTSRRFVGAQWLPFDLSKLPIPIGAPYSKGGVALLGSFTASYVAAYK